jgi:hypothetical protein
MTKRLKMRTVTMMTTRMIMKSTMTTMTRTMKNLSSAVGVTVSDSKSLPRVMGVK